MIQKYTPTPPKSGSRGNEISDATEDLSGKFSHNI